jgi:hypothetical protein
MEVLNHWKKSVNSRNEDDSKKIQIFVFCKLKFLTSAKIFPQAPVGNFFDQKAA